MELLKGLKRTHYCGDIRESDINSEVTVFGWVQRSRNLGGLIFIDLRDRSGIVQLSFGDETDREVFSKAASAKSEYVLAARGIVAERSSKNPDLPTGAVEIKVSELRILSKSETPPFEIIENCPTAETTRLKYRYLDLRRPDLQRNLLLRSKAAKVTRDYFYENGFIEIETPILIRSTPEGARDFLVPSRVHKGSFYALPQSPQLYKQLSMVAGFDRYIQLARAFRDEDLRADRQPEFTQIDLEMSFVDVDDVLEIVEGYISRVFKEVAGVDVPLPLPRLTYDEAMNRYGSDKPDTRFGLELFDLSDVVKGCGFGVFDGALENGGTVRGFNAKGAVQKLTRKEIDKLTETAKGIGAKGLAWIRLTDEGIASSFGKLISEDTMNAILARSQAEKGDVILIVADKKSTALSVLGYLRNETAKKLELITDAYNFLWITEFPFFDFDEETQQYVAMHHPFTSPMDESLPYLETDKARVKAKAYDLVLNGIELSSGSIRITNPELQSRIFSLLGLSNEEAQAKFGYLLDAFKYGAPPHGGMGIGFDRLLMQMLRVESLRYVVAYPKLKDGTEAMTDCPATVDDKQLKELGLRIDLS